MHYASFKTILSPENGMNLYRGCLHGCIYCDSRSLCYKMKHDFEDIEVKRNAAAILDVELKKKKPCMISTGSMSDPYNPLEKELQLTRECLKIIEKYSFGISILTKSALILRDIDILARINQKAKCVVQMTLTTYNQTLCGKIEQNVCSAAERFRVLKEMRNAKIPTVVWLSPILPFINDTEDNLMGILKYCTQAQVYGILCFGFGVTLRDGNREHFYKYLDAISHRDLKQQYIQKYGKSYNCISDNNDHLMSVLVKVCEEHGIVYKPDEIFSYLRTIESKEKSKQTTFFD